MFFPGKVEPDPSSLVIIPEDIIRDLTFLDPLSFYRLGKRLRHKATHVVITWWTAAWLLHTWLLLKGLDHHARSVFWCHNVVDHNGGFMNRTFTRLMLAQADCFMAHSEHDRLQLYKWMPDAQIASAPLPLLNFFAGAHPRTGKIPRREDANRNRIKRLLFFGFIRHYKGLSDLLCAIPQVLNSYPVELVVAGEFWSKTKTETVAEIERLQINDRVTIIDHYVKNEEIPQLFDNCDIVVLPYREATGSAVANLAVEMEKPLVVTDVGALPSCVIPGKTGWIAEAANPVSLAENIIKALETPFNPENLARAHETKLKGWADFMAAFESLF